MKKFVYCLILTLVASGTNLLGMSVTKTDVALLMDAAESGNAVEVERLIDKEVDLNQSDVNGHYPLTTAAAYGKAGVVKLFIDAKADLNVQTQWIGKSAIMLAAERDDIAVVQLLIDAQANLDLQDRYGRTALMMAISSSMAIGSSNNEAPKALIKAGANLELEDQHGWTAFTLADRINNTEIVELLKQHGAKQRPAPALKVFKSGLETWKKK